MRILSRPKNQFDVSHGQGSWLTLVLLFVVLVPAIGLLWFLNEAVQNEQLVVRQKLIDAYRAQLVGAQERLETGWQNQADQLARAADTMPPAQLFASLVRTGAADAVVCFDAAGAVRYPDAGDAPDYERPTAAWVAARDRELSDPVAAAQVFGRLAAESTDATFAARALQAQARCLVRAGDATAALTVLTGTMQEPRFREARDTQGRLLAPNADLLALELAGEVQPDAARAARERLHARVLDYEHTAPASAQRRFLMRELQRLTVPGLVEADPGTTTAAALSALLAAEDLAATYLAEQSSPVREPSLRPGPLPKVWQHSSANGRVLLLHRHENLSARLQAMIAPSGLPADVRLDFVEAGHEAEGALLSLPAGPALPGWRLALVLDDPKFFVAATSKQISSYVWIVSLIVVAALVLALLARGLVRRQVALTQLRSDLVANVTHELKTPLASMRLLVETLLNAPRIDETTTREYLQLIAAENLRLSRLIGNFLTFSRIERNKYTFDFKAVAPHAIVDGAVAAVRDRFQVPGCRFDVRVDAALPPITADADAVVTALVNLLDNAWKYTAEAKEITLTAGARNGSVEFTVRDNGIGLAPRETKRIFRRFHQVHAHLSSAGGGCGLGLSIVQFIVSAHRGAVQVQSEPGRGSAFTITVPRADAPA